ncbi:MULTISPECIES: M20/M25/M40 family metallo-hydrolase [unclassified Sphingopyxis]|uniref:M20/M25/M40 family metallo-hydrolase n=1 Tax=unclassified Sphingopyxis TaxID=2614943 RepID=UPI000A46A547|nr:MULTISPECIES: M20/M25/M40 family metallo-hydrolase [unclassified Sphingopyxis]
MLAAAALLLLPAAAEAQGDAGRERFRETYKELIETDTTLSNGDCTLASNRMKARLVAAGYPEGQFRVVVPEKFPKFGNLVGEIPGSDAKAPAILLVAHIDVVEAKREDWERDPFKLVEENGYFFARGAIDDKAMAAIFVDSLIRYREEKFKPRRTIKIALTCGEETDIVFDGVEYLLATEPQTLKAGFAINEGGKGWLDDKGAPRTFGIQVGEKVYQDFTLATSGPGGHSARPHADNPITRMSEALARVGNYHFPAMPGEAVRNFFARSAPLYPGEKGDAMRIVGAGQDDPAALDLLGKADPVWNAMIRTTCTNTQVVGGHAHNAVPQRAEANVNCRILPGTSVDTIHKALIEVVADPRITVVAADEPSPVPAPPPLTPEIMKPVEKLVAEMWPGVPVIPNISTGATDGRFLNSAGIPTYGISAIFVDPDGNGVHGLNERVRVKSLYDARQFLHRLVKTYASAK